MQVKEIYIVNEVENIYDDSTDVIVTLDDGFEYATVIRTPLNLLSLMKAENENFMRPGENFIIVQELTPEVIEEAVKAFVEEREVYWLKLFHVESYFDNQTLDNLRDKIIKGNWN